MKRSKHKMNASTRELVASNIVAAVRALEKKFKGDARISRLIPQLTYTVGPRQARVYLPWPVGYKQSFGSHRQPFVIIPRNGDPLAHIEWFLRTWADRQAPEEQPEEQPEGAVTQAKDLVTPFDSLGSKSAADHIASAYIAQQLAERGVKEARRSGHVRDILLEADLVMQNGRRDVKCSLVLDISLSGDLRDMVRELCVIHSIVDSAMEPLEKLDFVDHITGSVYVPGKKAPK